MFAEAVPGKKIVFLYRVHESASTESGTNLAFVTENSMSISKSADSTATKDGNIRTPGAAEITISSTSIFKKGDAIIEKLKKAMLSDKLLDIWRVNLDDPGTGDNKFKGTYYQGYLTSFEEASNAEDYVSYTLEFGINGNGADGDVTVTVAQQETAAYAFSDSVKTGA